MVGIGFLMFTIGLASLWLRYKKKLYECAIFHRIVCRGLTLGFHRHFIRMDHHRSWSPTLHRLWLTPNFRIGFSFVSCVSRDLIGRICRGLLCDFRGRDLLHPQLMRKSPTKYEEDLDSRVAVTRLSHGELAKEIIDPNTPLADKE